MARQILRRPGRVAGERVTSRQIVPSPPPPGRRPPPAGGPAPAAKSQAAAHVPASVIAAFATVASSGKGQVVPPPLSLSYSQVVLTDVPHLYWRMNETSGSNVADSSGNNLGATLVNTFTRNQAVILAKTTDPSTSIGGSGIGSDQAATAGGSVSGNRTAITLEAWIRTPQNGIVLNSDTGSGAGRLFQFNISAGKIDFILFDTGVGVREVATVSTSLADNNIHHIVGTYDGATMRLYIDGAADANTLSAAFTLNNVTGGQQVAIGGTLGASGVSLGGLVSNAAVYYTALSAARVSAHYTAGHG